ncbi:hypothetical protein FRC09_019940, partial [Ceratobasidium sp. 395]
PANMSNAGDNARPEALEATPGSGRSTDPSRLAGQASHTASPVQTPGSRELFGAAAGGSGANSPGLSHIRLPSGEGTVKEAGAHKATHRSSSVYTRELGIGSARNSEAGSASEETGRTRRIREMIPGSPVEDTAYIADDSENTDGEASESASTPRIVKIYVPDAEIERTHKEKLEKEKSDREARAKAKKENLEKEKKTIEDEIADEYREKIRRICREHARIEERVTKDLDAHLKRIQEQENMTAEEIRQAEKKEKKRRDKGSEPSNPDERKPIEGSTTPERKGDIYSDESPDEPTIKVAELVAHIPTQKKSRVSLGTSATTLMSQIPVTPAKGKAPEIARQQVPSGGYLGGALNPSTGKSVPVSNPGSQPATGQATTSKAVSFGQSSGSNPTAST